jgi:hypothetical protein
MSIEECAMDPRDPHDVPRDPTDEGGEDPCLAHLLDEDDRVPDRRGAGEASNDRPTSSK